MQLAMYVAAKQMYELLGQRDLTAEFTQANKL